MTFREKLMELMERDRSMTGQRKGIVRPLRPGGITATDGIDIREDLIRIPYEESVEYRLVVELGQTIFVRSGLPNGIEHAKQESVYAVMNTIFSDTRKAVHNLRRAYIEGDHREIEDAFKKLEKEIYA